MGKSVSVVNCPFRPLSRNIYSYSWIKPQACSFLLVSNKWFYFPILKKFRLILKFQCFIHFKVSSIPQVGPSWGWKFCNEKTQVLLVSSATLLLLLFRSPFFKSSSVRIGEQEEVRTGKVCPYDSHNLTLVPSESGSYPNTYSPNWALLWVSWRLAGNLLPTVPWDSQRSLLANHLLFLA